MTISFTTARSGRRRSKVTQNNTGTIDRYSNNKYGSVRNNIVKELTKTIEDEKYETVLATKKIIEENLFNEELDSLYVNIELAERIAEKHNLTLDTDEDICKVLDITEKLVKDYSTIVNRIASIYQEVEEVDSSYLTFVNNVSLVKELNKVNGLFHIDILYKTLKEKGIKYPRLRDFVEEGMETAIEYMNTHTHKLSKVILAEMKDFDCEGDYELSADLTMLIKIRITRAYSSLLAEIMFKEVIQLLSRYASDIKEISIPHQDRLLGADIIIKQKGNVYNLIRVYEDTETSEKSSIGKRNKYAKIILFNPYAEYVYKRNDSEEFYNYKYCTDIGIHEKHYTIGNFAIPRISYLMDIFSENKEVNNKEFRNYLRYLRNEDLI